MRDAVPHAYQRLPGSELVRVTPRVDRPYDAVFVIECSDITRPGLIDLERQFVVNIDHHSTTALFGDINWIDSTASAVGEMIYNLCKAIGVRVTQRDRRVRLHRAHHRHRQLPLLEHLRAHLQGRVGAGARGRQAGQGLAGRLRQLPLEQDRASGRGAGDRQARPLGAHRVAACRPWRCRSAPRPRTRTATASSTIR